MYNLVTPGGQNCYGDPRGQYCYEGGCNVGKVMVVCCVPGVHRAIPYNDHTKGKH